jgi:hypothetical protein
LITFGPIIFVYWLICFNLTIHANQTYGTENLYSAPGAKNIYTSRLHTICTEGEKLGQKAAKVFFRQTADTKAKTQKTFFVFLIESEFANRTEKNFYFLLIFIIFACDC